MYSALSTQANVKAHDFPFAKVVIRPNDPSLPPDYHYQIVIDTAHPKNAEDWVQGHLTLWLYGDNGNVIEKVQITR